jgi:hypothetical protein
MRAQKKGTESSFEDGGWRPQVKEHVCLLEAGNGREADSPLRTPKKKLMLTQ